MEAIVAVGLAGNVVQFVQFAGVLLAEMKSIHATGSPRSLPSLLDRTNDLSKQAGIIHDRLRARQTVAPTPLENEVSP
jgi:hypothetical protein